jgi:hypothetical protein
MTEQQRGKRNPADDVEGHAATFRGASDEPAQDEVEGHRFRGGVTHELAQDDDDTEGHTFRIRF